VDLAVARECEPPSVNVCLPCDACILGGFSGCFLGFFLVGFGLFRPGAARAPSVAKNYDKRIEINRYPIIRYPISIYFNSLIVIYIRLHALT
jgi:hypothetical protein